MDNLLDQQILKSDLDTGQEVLKGAAQSFNAVQLQVKENRILVTEKIAFYAAGIVSLSVTFVGYLIDKDKVVLQSVFLCIPIIYYLFISWLFLLVSLTSGLLNRLFDSSYHYFQALTDWLSKKQYVDNKALKLLGAGYPFVLRPEEDIESKKKLNQEAIEHNEKVLSGKKLDEKKYFKLKNLSFKITVFCFIVGLIVLFIFSTRIVYLIIW